MRGIKGMSPSLDALIESLPMDRWHRVLQLGFEVISHEFAGDSDIGSAIRQFTEGAEIADQALSRELAQRSQDADNLYCRLEEEGAEKSVYSLEFRRARVLYALSLAFSAQDATLALIDEVIYELGHGSADFKAFTRIVENRIKDEMIPL
jgi:hypothetical protein